MPERSSALLVCDSGRLLERGAGVVFDVVHLGEAMRAFALRVDGRVVAYLNRCAHMPSELDWQEGQFFDADKRWIICAIHGATYEPDTGRCVCGPCGGARLTPIDVEERDGRVYWYPSEHTVAAFAD